MADQGEKAVPASEASLNLLDWLYLKCRELAAVAEAVRYLAWRELQTSRNDARHSEEVLFNLSRLFPPDMRSEDTIAEVFVLVCASYLHDWGRNYKEVKGRLEHGPLSHYLIKTDERIRNLIACPKLRENIGQLALLHDMPRRKADGDEGEKGSHAEFVEKICDLHREHIRLPEDWDRPPPDLARHLPERQALRMPVLAALFRLADELDEEANRFERNGASGAIDDRSSVHRVLIYRGFIAIDPQRLAPDSVRTALRSHIEELLADLSEPLSEAGFSFQLVNQIEVPETGEPVPTYEPRSSAGESHLQNLAEELKTLGQVRIQETVDALRNALNGGYT